MPIPPSCTPNVIRPVINAEKLIQYPNSTALGPPHIDYWLDNGHNVNSMPGYSLRCCLSLHAVCFAHFSANEVLEALHERLCPVSQPWMGARWQLGHLSQWYAQLLPECIKLWRVPMQSSIVNILIGRDVRLNAGLRMRPKGMSARALDAGRITMTTHNSVIRDIRVAMSLTDHLSTAGDSVGLHRVGVSLQSSCAAGERR